MRSLQQALRPGSGLRAVAGLAVALSCLGAPGDAGVEDAPAAPVEPVPYDRSLYKHWIDADRDCLDTRQEVLAAESQRPVEFDEAGCKVTRGSWYDRFTGERWTDPSQLDIDHVVPLEEAHRSGGHSWTPEQREAYANDLDHPESLIAVGSSVNRSKGSYDPAGWLPPNESYRCEYVRNWVIVKATWRLSTDEEEELAIQRVLQSCGGAPSKPSDADPESPPSAAPAVTRADPPPALAAKPQAPPEPPAAGSGGCTDINSAASSDLERVSGIGPAKARAILEYRDSNGPFGTVDDVERVSGVGPATLRNIKAAGFCVGEGAPAPAEADADAGEQPSPAPQGPSGCTDINSADSATLQKVSGIGAARARAILEYRSRNGPFRSLSQVTAVSGVGPATLRNFQAAGYCAN